jgi:hypothetical protein
MLPEGKIAPADLELLVVSDSVEEICRLIRDCYDQKCWALTQSSAAFDLADMPPAARPDHAGATPSPHPA